MADHDIVVVGASAGGVEALAGLPADQVGPALRQAMSAVNGRRTTVVDATNRRGRPVRCRVTCSQPVGDDKAVPGVVVVVEPQPEGQPATG